MSVVKQKFVTVNGPADCLENALTYLAGNKSFIIDDPPENVRGMPRVVPQGEVNPYTSLGSKLTALEENAKAAANKQIKSKNAGKKEKAEGKDSFEDNLEKSRRILNEMLPPDENDETDEGKKILEQSGHVKDLGSELKKIPDFEAVRLRFGSLPRANYPKLQEYISNTKNVIFMPSFTGQEYIWGLYFTLTPRMDEADAFFNSLGFERIHISEHVEEYDNDFEKYRKKLTELTQICDGIYAEIEENKRILEQLDHLKNVNIELRKIFQFKSIKVRFGSLPSTSYERLKVYIGNMKSVIYIPSSIEEEYVWGVYFALEQQIADVDSLFTSLGFNRIHISERAGGIPAESYKELSALVEEKQKEYDAAFENLTSYSDALGICLESYKETLAVRSQIFENKKKTITTKEGFCLYGWVPAKEVAGSFTETLENTGVKNIATENPQEVEADPPVKLKNNVLFRPFEYFVEMYGTPSYYEIDPTPLVALTYSLFFGIMFGDLGQGAILVLSGLFLSKVKKMWLGNILATCGVFSMIFGTFYGSVFGIEDLIPHGFKASKNINFTLIVAVSFGVVMITICILLNIINGIRQKNVGKYILSQNGLVGLVFYWLALTAGLAALNIIKIAIPTSVILSILILCILLMFFREPLSHLAERRKNWIPEKKIEFLVVNLFELFEILLGFITNTLSFIRIGAFSLSHAGMMTVVFLLAQTANGSHNPIIIVIGNIVVIGLEGLVVGIQILRLEFYELFSRFYDGTGRNAKAK